MVNRPYRRGKRVDENIEASAEEVAHGKQLHWRQVLWLIGACYLAFKCSSLLVSTFFGRKAPPSSTNRNTPDIQQEKSKLESSSTTTPPALRTGFSVANNEKDRLTSPPPLPSKERKIVFVHLGNGGGLIMWSNLNQGPSKLSQSTIKRLHMWDTFPSDVEQATTLLFTLYNPVDRVISNYRHSHPDNCRKKEDESNPETYGCWLEERDRFKGGFGQLLFVQCFPSPQIEDFAQAILPPFRPNLHFLSRSYGSEQIVECRKAAREAVMGHQTTFGILVHNEYNYNFWADNTYRKFPNKEIFGIRKEHEFEDMVNIETKVLGGTDGSKLINQPINNKLELDPYFYPSPVSEEAYHKLCCVLENEIKVYLEIVEKAVNLEDSIQKELEQELKQKCGLGPQQWDAWRTACQQKLQESLDQPVVQP